MVGTLWEGVEVLAGSGLELGFLLPLELTIRLLSAGVAQGQHPHQPKEHLAVHLPLLGRLSSKTHREQEQTHLKPMVVAVAAPMTQVQHQQ